jgi:hypothetical protein
MHTSWGAADSTPATDDASMLREQDRHILRLLADAEAACGPIAWPRVETLIAALVDLYGAGITRLLSAARASARDDDELRARVAGDDLVRSLLILHQLHPPDEPSAPASASPLIPADRLVRGART